MCWSVAFEVEHYKCVTIRNSSFVGSRNWKQFQGSSLSVRFIKKTTTKISGDLRLSGDITGDITGFESSMQIDFVNMNVAFFLLFFVFSRSSKVKGKWTCVDSLLIERTNDLLEEHFVMNLSWYLFETQRSEQRIIDYPMSKSQEYLAFFGEWGRPTVFYSWD